MGFLDVFCVCLSLDALGFPFSVGEVEARHSRRSGPCRLVCPLHGSRSHHLAHFFCLGSASHPCGRPAEALGSRSCSRLHAAALLRFAVSVVSVVAGAPAGLP